MPEAEGRSSLGDSHIVNLPPCLRQTLDRFQASSTIAAVRTYVVAAHLPRGWAMKVHRSVSRDEVAGSSPFGPCEDEAWRRAPRLGHNCMVGASVPNQRLCATPESLSLACHTHAVRIGCGICRGFSTLMLVALCFLCYALRAQTARLAQRTPPNSFAVWQGPVYRTGPSPSLTSLSRA